MAETNEALILDLVEWIAVQPRNYEDVMPPAHHPGRCGRSETDGPRTSARYRDGRAYNPVRAQLADVGGPLPQLAATSPVARLRP